MDTAPARTAGPPAPAAAPDRSVAATPSSPGPAAPAAGASLATEVRESLLLLLLSVGVTAGVAGGASALLSALA
jgi:hypothetical protein